MKIFFELFRLPLAILFALLLGGGASYLLVEYGMKWPAFIVGSGALIGLFIGLFFQSDTEWFGYIRYMARQGMYKKK